MTFMQKLVTTTFAAALSLSSAISTCGPAIAQQAPLPDSGTYFIVNVASEQALQPVMPSIGQNVFLQPFTRAGLQKWTINRKIDATTKKPTNRYTIKLAGETDGLNFQPHPSVDSSAIISLDTSVFVLDSSDAGILIKSVAKNGDALNTFSSPPSETETRFSPDDGSAKFRWKFIAAN
jgi:hypothetical protein